MIVNMPVPPLWMGIPFFFLLSMIAVAPYAFARFWHRFEVPFLIGVSLLTGVGLWVTIGYKLTSTCVLHVAVREYIPFVILLSALYSISTGFHLRLKARGTPLKNTLFLMVGSILANFVGTTGASMILLRSFLHMNRHRQYKTHSVIFFIFLVANVGGCLTPIGDPPLFLGYLNGVDFFWPLKFLWMPFLAVVVCLLTIYCVLDSYFYRRDPLSKLESMESAPSIWQGKINILYLCILIFLIVGSGSLSRWFPNLPEITWLGQHLRIPELIRDGGLLILTLAAYYSARKGAEGVHHVSWEPVREVARVFAAIFITIIPLNLMLEAGLAGPLKPILNLTKVEHFWLTGIFSAFLDNAPTYLIFFKMAGGNATELMINQPKILMAISLGAVFMGAMTYIGNAPNFMVRSIAKQSGVTMPGFLGYMGWSFVFLLPLFLGVSLWWFH